MTCFSSIFYFLEYVKYMIFFINHFFYQSLFVFFFKDYVNREK